MIDKSRILCRSIAALAICLALSSPTHAQQVSASAIAAAKELIIVKGGRAMFEPIMPGVIESAKNMFLQTSPMLSKDLNEVSARLRKEYEPKQDELLGEVARLYAKRFTEQELKDLLTFYKSPLGKKMVTDEPIVIDESMGYTQNWSNKLSEQVIARMRAEMRKKGHEL